MIYYKFTKKPGLRRVPGYKSASDTEVSTYLTTDSILSESEELDVDGKRFICNIADGLFYPMNTGTVSNFVKTVVVDGVVVPQCKSGLGIFDSTKTDRKEIYRLSRNQHVIMNMGFITDANGNIWTSVSLLNDDLSYGIEKGYVIYKNKQNNFANLYIPNAEYKTVLTNGNIDETKVEAVKQQTATPRLFSSRAVARVSTTTGNVNNAITNASNRRLIEASTIDERDYTTNVGRNSPSIVQNLANFPPLSGSRNGIYQYDYALNYDTVPEIANMAKLYEHENMDVNNIRMNFKYNVSYYNRFKHAMPDDILSRGFMHIFFTRPDCNLMENGVLTSEVKNDPSLSYIYKKKPDLVKQLVLNNGESHDFMMLLSNKAKGFNLTDEGIISDKYGKSFGGHSISFARRKDTELGGTFDITYNDTRDLDIMNLHKLWIEYAVNVYRGKWTPRMKYIYGKILDYACSVYVILTAEDGESILFWTKYYGVFPINVPYSALSWSGNNVVSNPEYNISYQYSWKEDYNPLGLTELNINTFRTQHPKRVAYIPAYLPEIGSSGYTWVGAPFVETIEFNTMNADKTNGSKLTSKLRFTEK